MPSCRIVNVEIHCMLKVLWTWGSWESLTTRSPLFLIVLLQNMKRFVETTSLQNLKSFSFIFNIFQLAADRIQMFQWMLLVFNIFLFDNVNNLAHFCWVQTKNCRYTYNVVHKSIVSLLGSSCQHFCYLEQLDEHWINRSVQYVSWGHSFKIFKYT